VHEIKICVTERFTSGLRFLDCWNFERRLKNNKWGFKI